MAHFLFKNIKKYIDISKQVRYTNNVRKRKPKGNKYRVRARRKLRQGSRKSTKEDLETEDPKKV